jgi:hypothetical protein
VSSVKDLPHQNRQQEGAAANPHRLSYLVGSKN